MVANNKNVNEIRRMIVRIFRFFISFPPNFLVNVFNFFGGIKKFKSDLFLCQSDISTVKAQLISEKSLKSCAIKICRVQFPLWISPISSGLLFCFFLIRLLLWVFGVHLLLLGCVFGCAWVLGQ